MLRDKMKCTCATDARNRKGGCTGNSGNGLHVVTLLDLASSYAIKTRNNVRSIKLLVNTFI